MRVELGRPLQRHLRRPREERTDVVVHGVDPTERRLDDSVAETSPPAILAASSEPLRSQSSSLIVPYFHQASTIRGALKLTVLPLGGVRERLELREDGSGSSSR